MRSRLRAGLRPDHRRLVAAANRAATGQAASVQDALITDAAMERHASQAGGSAPWSGTKTCTSNRSGHAALGCANPCSPVRSPASKVRDARRRPVSASL